VNSGSIFASGLAAGLVANVIDFVSNTYILLPDWQEFAIAHNLDPGALTSGAAGLTWVAVDFLLGILLVWTYTCVRPRFGPGPKTAIRAGMILYVAITAVVLGFTAMGLMTFGMFVKGSASALVSTVAASLTGAALYRD
jgi:hypothetical protein